LCRPRYAIVCAARGLNFAGLGDHLQWCFELSTVSHDVEMEGFAKQLLEMKAEVIFLDPLYLSLGDVDPRNIFEMGQALRAVGERLLKAGCTPILVHHANGKLLTGDVMELQHLSYTGLEQYARQFFLINRKTAYKGDGKHDLWVNLGGSAGHGKLLSVTVEEGVIDRNFEGRRWDLSVKDAGEAKQDLAAERERAKAEAARKKAYEDGARVLDIIDAEEAKGGATKRVIRNRTGWGARRVEDAVAQLFDEGRIEAAEIKKAGGK
jgi:hypothetical protein